MKKAGEGTIIAVDLLRFACALLVLGYHFGAAFWLAPSPHGKVTLADAPWHFTGTPLAQIGWIGVELFFVISGMVIARSAVGLRWTAFLWKRALRLAPAAWICATLTLVVLAATGQFGATLASDWLRSVGFWPVGDQIDGSYWTLGIEVSFYLFMALCVGGGASAARIERAGIALGAASALFWLLVLACGGDAPVLLGNRTVMLSLLPHGCFFALGVVIGALNDGVTRRRAAALALLVIAAFAEIAVHVVERAKATGAAPSLPLAATIFLLGLALLLGAARLQPWFARCIAPEVARTIGLMTYPLYLLHQDAGAATMLGLARAGFPPRIAAGLAAAAMLALAWIVARALEPALRRTLARLPERRDREAEVAGERT